MRRLLAVCLVFALGAEVANGCEVKGDVVGVTKLDDFKKKYRRWIGFERYAPTCSDFPHKAEVPPYISSARMELGEIKCITTSDIEAKSQQTGTIAGVPADYVYVFLDETLSSIIIRFNPDEYNRVSEAFTAKFGVPQTQQLVYEMQRGGKVTGHKSTWKFPECLIEIEQFASSLTNSLANVYSPSSVAELDRRIRANPRPSGDL